MLKRLLIIGVAGITVNQIGYALTIQATSVAGTYQCQGYDAHDGGYQDATLTLTLDKKDSDFTNRYGAYHLKLVEKDGAEYLGEAVASGNTLAVYFKNTATSMPTDNGVGLATVTHDKDINGKISTVFHKFYYQPDYKGGGNGSETCVKKS